MIIIRIKEDVRRISWRQRIRKAFCLMSALSLLMISCGFESVSVEQDEDGELISLLEPVAESESYEKVIYRDLYYADVYAGKVFPDIVEYSFPANVLFDHYEVMLGDTVRKGTVLAYGDTEDLDERIKNLEEQIQDMEEQQQKYEESVEEQLLESEGEVKRLESIVEAYEKVKPEQYKHFDDEVPVSSGDVQGEEMLTEEYVQWEKEYNKYYGPYRILSHQNNTLRLQLEQKTAIYELDRAYLLRQLEQLRQQRKQYVITSSTDGEVVAMKLRDEVIHTSLSGTLSIDIPQGMLQSGASVSRGAAVIAVGNMERKVIKCNYIRTSTLTMAQEVYAFVDGVRYEVRHVNTDLDDYSTFELVDENAEISLEMDAFIVVIRWSRENALTIPASAVNRGQGGAYVYIKQGTASVMKSVTVGLSDGVYTEVLSGLAEGDEVAVDTVISVGSDRSVLKTGSPQTMSDYVGKLFYPTTYWVNSEIAHGTVYFTEYAVEPFQQVKAGDVIATIRVQGDYITLREYEVRLGRLNERLADLIAQGEEKNKDAIAQHRKDITELEKEIVEIKKDYGTTQIVAAKTGLILSLHRRSEGDIIEKGANIAEIADMSDVYIIIPDAGTVARYGENDIIISYVDANRTMQETGGKIVSLPSGGVSSDLTSTYALARIPFEAAEEMLKRAADMPEDYRGYVAVEMPSEMTGEVVLVPSRAVKVLSGQTYVMVVEDDGSIVAHSFIAAGSGNGFYWVIDGLTEGMEVCL